MTPEELLKSANVIARKRVNRASLEKIIRANEEKEKAKMNTAKRNVAEKRIEEIKNEYMPWEEFLFRYVLSLDFLDGLGRMEFVSHNLTEEDFLERWESIGDTPTLVRAEYMPLDGPDEWKTL